MNCYSSPTNACIYTCRNTWIKKNQLPRWCQSELSMLSILPSKLPQVGIRDQWSLVQLLCLLHSHALLILTESSKSKRSSGAWTNAILKIPVSSVGWALDPWTSHHQVKPHWKYLSLLLSKPLMPTLATSTAFNWCRLPRGVHRDLKLPINFYNFCCFPV